MEASSDSIDSAVVAWLLTPQPWAPRIRALTRRVVQDGEFPPLQRRQQTCQNDPLRVSNNVTGRLRNSLGAHWEWVQIDSSSQKSASTRQQIS